MLGDQKTSGGASSSAPGVAKGDTERRLEHLAIGLILSGGLLTASGYKESHPRSKCGAACDEMKLPGQLQMASGIVLILLGVLAM